MRSAAPSPVTRRRLREVVVAALAVMAVAFTVAAIVFGLIVVLYDHGGPTAHAAIGSLAG
jgi:hypothetical protein